MGKRNGWLALGLAVAAALTITAAARQAGGGHDAASREGAAPVAHAPGSPTPGSPADCCGGPQEPAPAQRAGKRVLRITADPNNLPFTNDKLEGVENKIADVI